jgi:hypothetical protein
MNSLNSLNLEAVLRIHDILVRMDAHPDLRIRTSD